MEWAEPASLSLTVVTGLCALDCYTMLNAAKAEDAAEEMEEYGLM